MAWLRIFFFFLSLLLLLILTHPSSVTNAMPSKCLPNVYYPLAVVGKQHLDSLVLTRDHYDKGLTRTGFIYAQMESAACLPSATLAVAKLSSHPSAARWRRGLASIPGFCHLRLIQYEWVVPALCALGAYPSATDVAALEPYFRTDRPTSSWAAYHMTRRRSKDVYHVIGVDRPSKFTIHDRLRGLMGCVVGANPHGRPPYQTDGRLPHMPFENRPGPSYPRPDPYMPISTNPLAQPTMNHPMPPLPHMTNLPMPPPHLLLRQPKVRNQRPPSRPKASNRSYDRNSAQRGDRPPPWKQAPAKALFQAYNTDPSRRRQGSPSAIAHAWRSAASDELDDVLASLKPQLDALPPHIGKSVWNKFLLWFQTAKSAPGFIRHASIPAVKEHFSSLFEPALASVKADAAFLAELEARSLELSSVSALVTSLQSDLANPPPGVSADVIAAKLAEAREKLAALDDEVDQMDADAVPPSVMEDAFTAGDDFIPVAPVWPKENFENFKERTSKFVPKITGKLPLDSLFVKMDVPSSSKVLLPRPLELYLEEEINSARTANRPPWFNRHEDPLEPTKCWSQETFARVYSNPGFHFLFARTAQVGPVSKDAKLPSLRSKLSARWGCQVEFTAMVPRQDWMLCTIPDVDGPRAEILTTAIMRLSEGNASYIVRHISALLCVRDLVFSIKGSNTDANGVYAQIRKKLLDFESRGVHLGWRVLGVRRTNAPSEYRGSFILDSPSVFWPWTFSFDHAHGSINPSSPLLNFDPPWFARKPYACQSCYSSVHATYECPLVHVKLGGVSLVSHTSITAVLNKKAGERLIITDKSLLPKGPFVGEDDDHVDDTPADLPDAPPLAGAPRVTVPHAPAAPLAPIPEGTPAGMTIPTALELFLTSKFRDLGFSPVPFATIRLASADGDVTAAYAALGSLIPDDGSWTIRSLAEEFVAWQRDNAPDESIHGWTEGSVTQSEGYTELVARFIPSKLQSASVAPADNVAMDPPPPALMGALLPGSLPVAPLPTGPTPPGALAPSPLHAVTAPITSSELKGPSGKAPAPVHTHTPSC